jgi:hypothetical protein
MLLRKLRQMRARKRRKCDRRFPLGITPLWNDWTLFLRIPADLEKGFLKAVLRYKKWSPGNDYGWRELIPDALLGRWFFAIRLP